MTRKPYPAYKTSGVEWLGDLPEQWDALPMKRRFHVVNGGTPSSSEESYWEYWEDGDIAWFTPEDLGRNHTKAITSSRRQITREGLLNCGASLTPRHSVLVSTRAPIGHVAISDVESCCNQGCRYFVKARDGLNPDFFYYAIVASKAVLQAAGKGTTFLELSAGMLGMHQAPMPPAAEQRAIADFLDRETGKIDRLVAKKRELIEKLKEERTALISRAVTRGLNPHAKLKPSGVEWLGDVPEHWEVVRLGRRIVLQRGVDITKDEQNEGCVPVVSSGGISSFHDRAFVTGPGVIVGRKGTAGAVYYIETDYWPHDTTLYVKEFHGNLPRFVYYKLCSMDLASFDTGSANPTVNRNLVHPVLVSWTSLPEQRAIASFLDIKTGKIDGLAAKVEEAIGRLREYRAALITAAVTGKIDVSTALDTGVSTGLNAGVRKTGAMEYPEPKSELLMAAEMAGDYKATDRAGRKRKG